MQSKVKSNYIQLSQDEDAVLLPGRHKCDCQASKHKLINNCLSCGRIVCQQEGSGPCAFCNSLVTSKEEQDIINMGTKSSEALQNKLLNNKKIKPKPLQQAIDHKNKLLEFDRNVAKRTKVYDDESDYFDSNSRWVDPKVRDKIKEHEEKLRARRFGRKQYGIDILGRKLVEISERDVYDPDDPLINDLLAINNYEYEISSKLCEQSLGKPKYVYKDTNGTSINSTSNTPNNIFRLQDKEIQEMRDEGVCLSMHQPWASLLVCGMKKHEGRTWYSSHRGRLWIASTVKVPTPDLVKDIEQEYRNRGIKGPYPKHYATGCLLGCVDVSNILPQEEYRYQYPYGESESPFVFVCENPHEMVLKFPIKGDHKIYKLDPKIHVAAQKSIVTL